MGTCLWGRAAVRTQVPEEEGMPMSSASGGGQGAGTQTLAGKRLRSVRGMPLIFWEAACCGEQNSILRVPPAIPGLTGQHLWRKKVLGTKWKESAFEEQLQF